jgi:hypothetical protein
VCARTQVCTRQGLLLELASQRLVAFGEHGVGLVPHILVPGELLQAAFHACDAIAACHACNVTAACQRRLLPLFPVPFQNLSHVGVTFDKFVANRPEIQICTSISEPRSAA